MASVIFEGGNSPIEVKTWQDSLKVELLHRMYNSDAHKNDLFSCADRISDLVAKEYSHRISANDVAETLKEMFKEGWIEVSAANCECCMSQYFSYTNFLKHATRLRLTKSGYNKVPEHIFP